MNEYDSKTSQTLDKTSAPLMGDHARCARFGSRPGLLVVCCLACISCSTANKSEAPYKASHLPYRLAPQVISGPDDAFQTDAAREKETETGPGIDKTENEDMEAALDLFVMSQNMARLRAKERSTIASDSLLRWSELLGHVDRALQTPAKEIVPLAFVRMRVVLESELELDALHYGTLPPWLPIALRARSQGIEMKLEQRRAMIAPSNQSAIQTAHQSFRWPLEQPLVTSLFGVRHDPFTGQKRFHRGVDLRARTRQSVEAIAAGTVTRAAENGGYGLSVEILHDNGFTSTYSHLSLLLVQQNDRVEEGSPIGLTGNTGRSTASHLHFELWQGEKPVDPLDFLETPEMLKEVKH